MELSIEEVISEVSGVEGIGQGKVDDKDCILVLISVKTPEIEKVIPPEFKGFTVKVIESGVICAEKPQQK